MWRWWNPRNVVRAITARRQHRYGRPVASREEFNQSCWRVSHFGRIPPFAAVIIEGVWLVECREIMFCFSCNNKLQVPVWQIQMRSLRGVAVVVVGVVITAQFSASQTYLIPQGPGPHKPCTNSNCESHAAFVTSVFLEDIPTYATASSGRAVIEKTAGSQPKCRVVWRILLARVNSVCSCHRKNVGKIIDKAEKSSRSLGANSQTISGLHTCEGFIHHCCQGSSATSDDDEGFGGWSWKPEWIFGGLCIWLDLLEFVRTIGWFQ